MPIIIGKWTPQILFSLKESLAPQRWKRFPAHADQNSAQSRQAEAVLSAQEGEVSQTQQSVERKATN
jgi:hypothetical protein